MENLQHVEANIQAYGLPSFFNEIVGKYAYWKKFPLE